MAFRRQDIPKTTRKGSEGEPRRLYPRFAKDRSLLPKIDLAIGYLDGMVGRRRGDLAADVVLELFGDPKLARCVVACLADSYRYRTPEIAEIVGEEAATALAGWEIMAPADLRAYLYRAANDRTGGFVTLTGRRPFLDDVGSVLGLTATQLDELLHLDADRNAVLIRVGPRPFATDVLARYNVMLGVSVLRLASTITLELPGLDLTTIETVCARWEVRFSRLGPDTVRLSGRQSGLGSWSQFGSRLARCVLHLVMVSPGAPSGEATVHLTGAPLTFLLDRFVVGLLRPPLRAVAGTDGVVRAALLANAVSADRRRADHGWNGWVMRRALEPVVVDGAICLPELTFTRDQAVVAVVPVPRPGAGKLEVADVLAAMVRAGAVRPTVALGEAAGTEVPAVAGDDAVALLATLKEIDTHSEGMRTPLAIFADEVLSIGWVGSGRLAEVFGEGAVEDRLRPMTTEGENVLVPGFGLCRVALLEELLDRGCDPTGPLDVPTLRLIVGERVGAGAGADALTLYLLGRISGIGPLKEIRSTVERAA